MLSVRRPRPPESASRREPPPSVLLCSPTMSRLDKGRRCLEEGLHSESTGWVLFYALLVIQSYQRGLWHVALKNGFHIHKVGTLLVGALHVI